MTPPAPPPDAFELNYAALARSSRIGALVSALGLLALIGSIAYSSIHLARIRTEVDAKQQELSALQRALDETATKLRQQQEALKQTTPLALQTLGYKNPDAPVDPRALTESVEAKRAAEQLAVPGERGRRSMITLQYYEKRLDDEVNMRVVLSALSEAGFSLQRKQAQLPGVPTNAIFCGPDVRSEDMKLVALTLIGAGIQIRTIEALLPHVSKPRLIQIGADLATRNAPPLTTKQILDAPSICR